MDNTAPDIISADEAAQLQAQPIAPPQIEEGRAPAAAAPDIIPADAIPDEEKYGSTGQQLIAGLEGAAKGIAGPLAPLAETKLLGVKPEDIRAREEENPITSTTGEIGGLIGSTLAGVGLGAGLAKVGAGVSGAAQAAGIGKIGSTAAAAAIENMVFQGQDEVSKLVLGDPSQSAQSAAVDVGIAGVLGGVLGAGGGALWKAMEGKKLGGLLGAVADKMGGIEGVAPEGFEKLLDQAGVQIAPELRTLVAKDPAVRETANRLIQISHNPSGIEFQEAFHDFRNTLSDSMIRSLGKTPEEVAFLPQKDLYSEGKKLASTLADEYEAQLTPLAKTFDELKSKVGSQELSPTVKLADGTTSLGTIDKTLQQIGQRAIEEGWAASPSSDIMKEVRRVIKELPLQKNVKNLGDFITQVGNNTTKAKDNGPLIRAGGILKSILKDAEADVISTRLGETAGADAVAAFKQARSEYAALSSLKDALNDRLHIKSSTSSFAKALREAGQTDAETVLNRLSGKNDANLLQFLQENYPQTAKTLADYHLNTILRNAAEKAGPREVINNTALIKSFREMSPQMRQFIASPEAASKMTAVDAILNEFKNPKQNFSNTARTLASILKDVPGTAIGAAAAVHGKGLAKSAIIGAITKAIGQEVPDAIRLSILKWLGSPKPINPGAFRSMVDYVQSTIRGENMTAKAVSQLLKGSREVIPAKLMPSDSDRRKIERHIDSIQQDPNKVFGISGDLGHYMPNQAVSLSKTASDVMQYLKENKPQPKISAPLDPEMPLNAVEKAKYNRLLDLAQQPLLSLQYIADGTITANDVNAMKTMYPDLYNRISSKIMEEAAFAKSKGKLIPYNTKMGISLFVGQGLDTSLTPIGILSAQPKPAQPQQPSQGVGIPAKSPSASSMNSLNKMPNMYRVPNQAAEMDRLKRGR